MLSYLSMLTLASTQLAATGDDHSTSAATALVQTPAEQFAQTALLHTVDIGIVALGVSIVICLYRILKGPTLADRGVASDVIALQVVGLAILLTIRLDMLVFFDAVLIVAILGFASTIAFAQFIGRRRAV